MNNVREGRRARGKQGGIKGGKEVQSVSFTLVPNLPTSE
jgi:hypothetical protein